jgi:hypothetical protein
MDEHTRAASIAAEGRRMIASRPVVRVAGALSMAVVLLVAAGQPVLASHAVKVSGIGSITNTFGVDLDDGVFNAGSYATNDAWVAFNCGGRCIAYSGSARIKKMHRKPTYSACQNAALGQNEYRVGKAKGHWFCVGTSEGRLGRFRVLGATSQHVDIRFLTWCQLRGC